ncbi:MAG TPA: type 1 glutamine amidotransferase [Candidatus Omnitrophota bacterium]|nr:type 1 glutamine amidotransferase [Candidatus Omnitrophota bacterium]HPD84529.1 type 1 glutamine amidotransferase [Candidatus Omnitrophota bacterium]HRZ03387.1 type 1 glutamine amidotransferase [Candidatus Omnitrophota bacterium]
MILIVKHIAIEGPGTFEYFLKKKDLGLRVIELGGGESLPKDTSPFKAVIVLGGPMNVYEEEAYPFLKAEDLFLKDVLEREIPLLGICLGSQLIAKACGAKVAKAPVKEVGWKKVSLTKEGKADLIFNGLKNEFDVFQWHEDTFDIPENGQLLATARSCPHQAFRVGKNAYGVQFHVEVTGPMINDWAEVYLNKEDADSKKKKDEILKQYKMTKIQYDSQAEIICNNFLNLAKLS